MNQAPDALFRKREESPEDARWIEPTPADRVDPVRYQN